MSSVVGTLTLLGGCATWYELAGAHRKRALQKSVASGEIVKVARGRYVTAAVAEQRRLAHEQVAVLSHLSAALHLGWKVKTPPDKPALTVPQKRHVTAEHRKRADVHYADLLPRDTSGGATLPLRTVLDCARALPFDEALAVADSALRSELVSSTQLVQAAAALRGPGSRQARRVAAHANSRAANPLESVLRAIVLDIPGVTVVLQHEVAEPGVFAVVDLADPNSRLVIEAEGFEYHGSRENWRKDCRRYTDLVAARWWVLRFTYEDVMHHPERVRASIESWLRNGPQEQVIAS